MQVRSSPRTLCKKIRYSRLGFDYRYRQPMRSVAARSSRPLQRMMVPDWLHGFLKLGDPDLASAVFPAYAENNAGLFVCIGCWERYRMCVV